MGAVVFSVFAPVREDLFHGIGNEGRSSSPLLSESEHEGE
jgi:hypothetical protein